MSHDRSSNVTDQRQDLLRLLHHAHGSARKVGQLLKRLIGRHAVHDILAAPIESFLTQTLDQQRLLLECISRIGDGEVSSGSLKESFTVMHHCASDRPVYDVLHDVALARTLTLEDIDLYSSVIVTAESGGFFETRHVCEGILLEKSSMADWLSRTAAVHAVHIGSRMKHAAPSRSNESALAET